jgi:purine-binding chemotaxis protein CheW
MSSSSSLLSESVLPGSSRGSQRGSRSTTSFGTPKRICTFLLGKNMYAVDVRIVRRILPINNAVPVPRSNSAIVGLQIQRGVTVPLLNACELLGLHETFDAHTAPTALVIEADGLHFGLTIARVDAVVTVRREDLRARTSESEPEVIAGIYEAVGTPPQPVTLVSTEELLKRVSRLRFRNT